MASFKLVVLMTVASSHVAFAGTPVCANEEGMGYDDPQHQNVNGAFVHDASTCQGTCKMMWFCKVFTYYPNSGGCFLQGELAVLKPLKGAISGPKFCDTYANLSDAVISIMGKANSAIASGAAANQTLQEQITAATDAAKAAASRAGVDAAKQHQLIASSAGDAAAQQAKAQGNTAEEQVQAAAEAAKDYAKKSGLDEIQQAQYAAAAAGYVKSSIAKEDGKSLEDQLAAAQNASHRYAKKYNLDAEGQAKQAAAAVGNAGLIAGQSSDAVAKAAAEAAKAVGAEEGLTPDVQSTVATEATDAINEASKKFTEHYDEATDSAASAIDDAASTAFQAAKDAGKNVTEQVAAAARGAVSAAKKANLPFADQAEVAAKAAADAGRSAGLTETQQLESAAMAAVEVAVADGKSPADAKVAARTAIQDVAKTLSVSPEELDKAVDTATKGLDADVKDATAAAAEDNTTAAAAAVAATTTEEVTTTIAAEPTATTPEPAPTSSEEAAKQAVEKLGKLATPEAKAVAAATAAASFAKSQGVSKDELLEVAESAAKSVLENITGIPKQLQVNHMAAAVGTVAATELNVTKQDAADQTRDVVDGFAKQIYADPQAALAAVGAASLSISAATGAYPAAREIVAEAETSTSAGTDAATSTTTEAAETTNETTNSSGENVSEEAAKMAVNGTARSISDADSTSPNDGTKTEEKPGGILPLWAWVLIALAGLALLAGCAYMFCSPASSKDKKKKKINKTSADDLPANDLEGSPLLRGTPNEAPTGSPSVAPAAGAVAGDVVAGSVAQGSVLSQGSPAYSTSARGLALPQASPVAGSSIAMLPQVQAAPASVSGTYAVASPVMVQSVQSAQPMMMMSGQAQFQGQPMMMAARQATVSPGMPMGGMSVVSQGPSVAQAPAGVQMSAAQMELFNRLDANHDGQLSQQEFAQLAALRQ